MVESSKPAGLISSESLMGVTHYKSNALP